MEASIEMRLIIMIAGAVTFLATSIVLFFLRGFWRNCNCSFSLSSVSARSAPMCLLMCILHVDMFYGLTVMGAQMFIDHHTVCVFEGTVGGFCSVCSALLTACLARDSFRVARIQVRAQANVRDGEEVSCGLLDWCWDLGLGLLVPLGCVLGISLTEGYGNRYASPVLCHLYDATLQGEIAGFYGWIWFSLLVCFYYNIRIVLLLRQLSQIEESSVARRLRVNLRFMLLYPLIYTICCLPSFAYRMMRFWTLQPSPVLFGIGQSTFALVGFFDALVLGCSNQAVQRHVCSRRRRRKDTELLVARVDEVIVPSATSHSPIPPDVVFWDDD